MSTKSYSSSGFNGDSISDDSISDIFSISSISDFSSASSIPGGSMFDSITSQSMPSFMGISLLDYTDPENYMYYGGAAAVILLIIGVIMKKRGTFEKIKKKIVPSAKRGYSRMDDAELGNNDFSDEEDELMKKMRLPPKPVPKDY